MNPGFGYQSWNAKQKAAPNPQQMGAALSQQQMGMPSLGVQPMMAGHDMDESPAHEMAPGDALEDMNEREVDGQDSYDPGTEHSATNTRAALEDAVRRSLSLGDKQALKRPPAPNQSWQLATLGLDPLSIQLYTETGDAAGGLG